jgi:hypothetical protein
MKKPLNLWHCFAILILGALCVLGGKAVAQDYGVSSHLAYGSALPSGAEEWSFFTLTDGTGLYQCQHSPYCTTAGQWVAIGGSGGTCSGTCANLALSNLSDVAIAVPIESAAGYSLYLVTPNDNGSAGAHSIEINSGTGGAIGGGGLIQIVAGGAGSSTSAGGEIDVISGGGGASTSPGGPILIETGGGGLNAASGTISIATGNASYAGHGASGNVVIATGLGTSATGYIELVGGNGNTGSYTGPGGSIFLRGGIAGSGYSHGDVKIDLGAQDSTRNSAFLTSYYTNPTLELFVGDSTTGAIGDIQIDTGNANSGASDGYIYVTNGIFYYKTDNTADFDSPTQRPRNLYLGGNIVAGGNALITGYETVNGAITGNSVATNGSGPWSVSGNYGTLSAALSGKTMFGLGVGGVPSFSTAGVNSNAITLIAFQDGSGNVAQNANTATKLAAAGTACSGEYSTGVDQYGNALCGAPTYIQLQQIAAPTCVNSFGLMWFDSSGAIKANVNCAGPVSIGFSILSQSTDTLIQSDLANAQTYDLYGGTDSGFANYNRLRLGLDSSNNNFVLASESAGTPPDCSAGNCGIEIQIGSTVKWVFGSNNAFYPFANVAFSGGAYSGYDLGQLFEQPRFNYSLADVEVVKNDTSTGTTLNYLATTGVVGGVLEATIASASETSGIAGVVVSGAGSTFSAGIAHNGMAGLVFDGAVTAGDYVIASSTAGKGHDAGTTCPTVQTIGIVQNTQGSPGTTPQQVLLGSFGCASGGGGMTWPTSVGIQSWSSGTAWGTAYGVSGTGTTIALTASPAFTGTMTGVNATFSGNVSIGGSLTMTTGAPEVTYTYGTALTAPSAGQASFGVSTTGYFQIAPAASATFYNLPIVQTCGSHKWLSVTDQLATVGNCTQPTLADVAAGAAAAGTYDFTGATPKVPTGTANSNNTNAASEAYVDTTYMGTWLQFGPPSSVGSNITVGGSNATHGNMFEFNIPSAITTGHIEVDVTTADNSANTYDFCLYSGAASSTVNLLAHTGAVAGSAINSGATGYVNLAWTGAATLAPGRYYLFLFGNEATPTLTIGGTTFTSFYHNASQSITPTSGACSATLSSSADSPGQPTFPWFTLN